MIKIGEVCQILGLDDDEKGKSKAREVVNFFKVHTSEEAMPDGKFGKPAKLYARNQIVCIAGFQIDPPIS